MSNYQIYYLISLAPIAYAIATSLPVMVTDIFHRRVPNKFILPLIFIAFTSMLGLTIWQGTWARFGLAMLAGLFATVLGSVLNVREIIGMGDVKLLTGLSMIIGWHSFILGLALMPVTIIVGIVTALAVLLVKHNAVVRISPFSYLLFSVVIFTIK